MSGINDCVRHKHSGPAPCLACVRPRRSLDDATPEEWNDAARRIQAAPTPAPSALAVQVGGGHYKAHGIQPIQYIHANGIPFAEGCVIKYVSRWRDKGGLQDLHKAKHFIELLIELETQKGAR